MNDKNKYQYAMNYDKIDYTYTVDFAHLIPEPRTEKYDGNKIVSWDDCDWKPEEYR